MPLLKIKSILLLIDSMESSLSSLYRIEIILHSIWEILYSIDHNRFANCGDSNEVGTLQRK